MKTISLALLVLILAAACRKTSTQSGSGYWYFSGKKYLVNYTSRKDTAGLLLLTAMESLPTAGHPRVNSLSILFGSTPTADSAGFQPADLYYPSGGPHLPGPGQIWGFGTSTTPYDNIIDSCGGFSYITTKWEGVTDTAPLLTWRPAAPAIVSVNNGKISITLPPIGTQAINRCGLDSPSVYGFIKEQ